MNVEKLLVATGNINKLKEIIQEMNGLPVEIVGLNDVAELVAGFEVEETEDNFEGNAILKAKQYAKKTGMLTLADDSGLCVDALGGRPGVYSARYAPGTGEDRNNKLLEEMSGVPEDKRTARYVAAVAIYDPETDKLRTCEGKCEGYIKTSPSGNNGFGYDPIFFCTEANKTMAELTMDEKNAVSHRGKALKQAKEILERDFG